MANIHALREVHYSSESTFGDSSTTTYATRIPVIEPPVLTISQERADDASLQSRSNESRPGYLGIRSASLEFKCYLGGHGTSPTAALTENWIADLLGDGLGGISTAAVGTVLNGTPSVTSLPTAAGTFVAGGMGRIGTIGDGGGSGQAFVSSSAGTTGTCLLALPAAPAAGAQYYAMTTVYPSETLGSSKRFMVMHSTTGAQYHVYGCQLETVTFGLEWGALPTVTFRYVGAYWHRNPITFPSSATLEDCKTAPTGGGGSFAWQTTGTTTRATLSPSSVQLTLDMGLAQKMGPAANQAAYQVINGYERTKIVPTLQITVPWEDTFESLFDTDGSSTTHKQFLWTLNSTPGAAVAIYLPRAYPVGMRPSGVVDSNGLNYVTATFRGRESATTTNELTRSAFRIGLG